MSEWRSDIGLDLEAAHATVCRQFPEYFGLEPREVGQGWDNLCVGYPNGVAFRLPVRAVAAEIIVHEIAALPVIAPRVPLPVPDVRFVGVPDDGYPYPFFGFTLLPGRTADRRPWSDLELTGAADSLGGFLSALHGLGVAEGPLSRLPGDLIHRADPARLLERIERRAGQIGEDVPSRSEWARDLAGRAAGLLSGLAPLPDRTVVHGDLYPRHVLCDGSGRVSGVIDWGDVHIGHPGLDLSLGFTFFSGLSRAALWAAYGAEPDSPTLRLAQARACNYALALFAYGLDVSDEDAVRLADSIASLT